VDGLSEGELKLQARVVGAARGVRWLTEGWRFFRAAPLGWTALVFGYLLLMMVAWSIPVAGVLAAAVFTPSFSVSFMAVARAASRGAPIELPLLLEGFKLGLRAQVALGFVYLACVAAIVGASSLFLGEMPALGAGNPEDPGAGLAVIALLYAPVMMMFWFAPILAAWHSTTVAKALFFSFVAFLMNWRAFLTYGAVTAAAIFVVTALVILLARLISSEISPASLVLPMFIVVFPTLAGSYYASYRDVFAETTVEPTPEPTAGST
jgi:hypothetical protein